MNRDPVFQQWVDEARAIPVLDAANGFSHELKRSGSEYVGPCPACGGRDRFSINPRKNVWHCRRSAKGGDAIALVEYVTGCDFRGACEYLTGRPAPSGERGAPPDKDAIERRRREAADRERQRDLEAQSFRSREIARAHRIWADAGPIAGSTAEAYLRSRGLQPAAGAKLRGASQLPFWHFCGTPKEWRIVHQGPAMIAAIQGGDGRFCGCHCTWIDLGQRNGKAAVVDPDTGEFLPSKKVRGSAKAGHIHLGGPHDATRLIVGEGIETVYAVREALVAEKRDIAATAFWAAVSLGNIGGKARAQVAHPHLTRRDSRGRVRRLRVPGPVPDFGDRAVMMPLPSAHEIVILGDGDSDRFTTENALRRAAVRWHEPGRRVRIAWADSGSDFNDMLRSAA